MANIYFTGTATAVAQISEATVGGTITTETFTISVGGVVIATYTPGTATVAAVVAGLVSSWNASTHPYAVNVTATDASPIVRLTSDVAGMPFIVTLNTPGGATTFTLATPTVSAGPNHLGTASNWSTGTVPTIADVVILKNCNVNICWDLDQSAVTLNGLRIYDTYTGRIGLDYRTLATSADGTLSVATKQEYRNIYLQYKVNSANGPVTIGEQGSSGTGVGSGRILLDLGTQAARVIVYKTGTSVDLARPACRLKCNSTTTTIDVRNAAGGFGLAAEIPGETSTAASVFMSDGTGILESGVTLSATSYTIKVDGGQLVMKTGGLHFVIFGGVLKTEGSEFVPTVCDVFGGLLIPNHTKTGAAEWGTINIDGGTVDATMTVEPRTCPVMTFNAGKLRFNESFIVTTLDTRNVAGPGNDKSILIERI